MTVLSEIIVITLCLLLANNSKGAINVNKNKAQKFPYDFEFGASTAAYQTEGAWNIDGKGWSMWDHYVHTKADKIVDGSNGDDATKSYFLYKRDVEMLKELGVDSYRMSIAWSRILPYGHADYVNAPGVAYYNNLIDELLANGITPYVTIYHWDIPQNLNEQGGWLNEKVVEWFGQYARVVYKMFGDRVKNWMTINEPFIHCSFGFEDATHPPAIHSPGEGYYECGRNVLLAHARAYHIYKNEFKASQKGQVGFVGNLEWGIPATNCSDDIQAAYDYIIFHVDHFVHPIFAKEGNYPQRLIDIVAENSAKEGRNSSRLRPFTQKQVEYIKGTGDFIGLNHYATLYVSRNSSLKGRFAVPSLKNDMHFETSYDPSWPSHGWGHDYAPGLYSVLMYLKNKYDDPLIYVTENGISSDDGLVDDMRADYIRNYLSAVLDALRDGVNVRGYFPWSLMDNFEWLMGYQLKFGLYHVDMVDKNRTRTPKKSALVFKEIIRSRVIDYDYNPNPYKIAFGAQQDDKEKRVSDAATTHSYTTVVVFVTLLFKFSTIT